MMVAMSLPMMMIPLALWISTQNLQLLKVAWTHFNEQLGAGQQAVSLLQEERLITRLGLVCTLHTIKMNLNQQGNGKAMGALALAKSRFQPSTRH